MNTIIRSIRTFIGGSAPGLHSERVVVLSVQRGGPDGAILGDDLEVGELRQDDVLEIAQIVTDVGGRERLARGTCDAQPHELGRAEGIWRGSIETGIVLRAPDPRRN